MAYIKACEEHLPPPHYWRWPVWAFAPPRAAANLIAFAFRQIYFALTRSQNRKLARKVFPGFSIFEPRLFGPKPEPLWRQGWCGTQWIAKFLVQRKPQRTEAARRMLAYLQFLDLTNSHWSIFWKLVFEPRTVSCKGLLKTTVPHSSLPLAPVLQETDWNVYFFSSLGKGYNKVKTVGANVFMRCPQPPFPHN